MKHTIAYIKIIHQVYYYSIGYVKGWLIEIRRDGKRRIYAHTSKTWRLWLEKHTGTYIFGGENRFYPKEAFNKFGIPTPFMKEYYGR